MTAGLLALSVWARTGFAGVSTEYTKTRQALVIKRREAATGAGRQRLTSVWWCAGRSPAAAIRERLGDKVPTAKSDPTTLFFSWFYAAQRDFTYISLAGSYKPIAEALRLTLRRACLIVAEDNDSAAREAVSEADVQAIMAAFKGNMKPREGLKECFDGLRDAGWDVYAVTNGGVETSHGYYRNANIDLDRDHLLSCDDLKVAKPDVRVYQRAQDHLDKQGLGDERATRSGQRWFVAAHAWELIAARAAGFKTAYLDFEEHDPVTEVFGEFDLYATSMVELLQKMKVLKK
ncbi:HAD-like domain-containing protein [Microdochium trichocladiopsis]|uniref:HAD-like domain-containing protein n=1 Tax=Microdochium trichocladiopsis TaxID=1682393 RepID=A0A9P8XWK0_9PEZI|nr:HAD-like domain-containing protein [Microdochium trichocladiopsis]KAH7016401.1 HAD-like domain-containing protein [Microdochium trichocladiopsis]